MRHNAWATLTLLDFCARLSEEQLAATTPGAYGSILATLQHMIEGEASYRRRLTSEWPGWYWQDREPPGIEGLRPCVEDMGRFWEQMLDEGFDPDRPAELGGFDGKQHRIPAGVLVAQTLNHGNVHRDQINTILTTLGLQPPELDGWSYGLASGRIAEV